MTDTAKTPPAGKTAKSAARAATITVLGPPQGRRRAGVRFGPEPVEIPAAKLSKAQLEALKSDPLLSVSET